MIRAQKGLIEIILSVKILLFIRLKQFNRFIYITFVLGMRKEVGKQLVEVHEPVSDGGTLKLFGKLSEHNGRLACGKLGWGKRFELRRRRNRQRI